MFYPLEGLCEAEPEGGPIVFTLDFIGVGKGTGGFKIHILHWPFWNLENVLSPGGTLQSRARRWSNCFYFRFYWCRKRYWGFQNPPGYGALGVSKSAWVRGLFEILKIYFLSFTGGKLHTNPPSFMVYVWLQMGKFQEMWPFYIFVRHRWLNCYIGKKLQKNFLIGLKIWWSWGSRIFFSKSP